MGNSLQFLSHPVLDPQPVMLTRLVTSTTAADTSVQHFALLPAEAPEVLVSFGFMDISQLIFSSDIDSLFIFPPPPIDLQRKILKYQKIHVCRNRHV